MLVVTNTGTDKLQITTSSAATVDVHASWADLLSGAVTPGRTNTAISSAATTDVVATPASSTTRNVKTLHVRNKDTSLACDITVVYNQNGTSYQLHKVTLNPGDTLEYIEGIGFFTIASTPATKNQSVSSQSPFSSDTYLTGSSISVPSGSPAVGSMYRLLFDVTKTGAGTATPVITVRFGTAGAVGDTSRCAFTFGAGTGVIDAGTFEAICVFRTVGSGTAAIIQGICRLTSNLTTTGISNAVKTVVNTGGGFDSTVANSFIGASYNGGASASHTIQLVRSEWVG